MTRKMLPKYSRKYCLRSMTKFSSSLHHLPIFSTPKKQPKKDTMYTDYRIRSCCDLSIFGFPCLTLIVLYYYSYTYTILHLAPQGHTLSHFEYQSVSSVGVWSFLTWHPKLIKVKYHGRSSFSYTYNELHIPYARHYNPRFVYFLPAFWRPKTFF